ncbi:hypothetical protein [uncultured Chryseobacterium sp.]|uniref:hypothetical protein n=1 Tax=uncultured Chryseobacterium sp. TaxID=259322 RepID=UPI0025EDFE6F|nr:hypothetical protein [uncultured Chryseobacterium sp.]
MKQLSEPALRFMEKAGRNTEYWIDPDVLKNHLRIYHLEDSTEILRFQEIFAGLHFQDTVIHIFTPEQIRERKTVNTYEWKSQTLFPVNNGLYIAENGEIAVRDSVAIRMIFIIISKDSIPLSGSRLFLKNTGIIKISPLTAMRLPI